MGLSVFPAPASGPTLAEITSAGTSAGWGATGTSKTAYKLSLTSGSSWTVPAGVTYVNVTLRGGGGGGHKVVFGTTSYITGTSQGTGHGGQVVSSTVNTTPGASIAYSIGAGGTGGTSGGGAGGTGGTTTFAGATSAAGGLGSPGDNTGSTGTAYLSAGNGGGNGSIIAGVTNTDKNGGAGGAGSIDIEYWA